MLSNENHADRRCRYFLLTSINLHFSSYNPQNYTYYVFAFWGRYGGPEAIRGG